MALDFQQVRDQVHRLGEQAPQREQRLLELRQKARHLLDEYAENLDAITQKVGLVVRSHDPSLRCALPVAEPLTSHLALPELTQGLTVLAADGSQIAPDRHAEVEYCLINVGAVQMRYGAAEPAETRVSSRLFYAEEVETPTGLITDATLALRRDLNERKLLAEMAGDAVPPVVTFTDGPMELWGGRDRAEEEASEFQKSLDEYKGVLTRLNDLQVITAGYVDKPGANLLVRMLEVMDVPDERLPEIRKQRPLRGVRDFDLFRYLLGAGERSAVFALQSQSALSYPGPLALHFFYLNTGRPGHPWLARVEIPAWVAQSRPMLDTLQAALVQQCRAMGNRPYPYILHRAHETAVVSLQEKEQVTQMIMLELSRHGIMLDGKSQKQALKELPGRVRTVK